MRAALRLEAHAIHLTGRVPRASIAGWGEVYFMRYLYPFLLLAALPVCPAQPIDAATRQKYEQILDTEHRGGHISKQERELLMSVYPKLNPPRDSMGFTALNDLGAGHIQRRAGRTLSRAARIRCPPRI